VNPQVPAASAAELIAYARANPGKLTYGSAGSGSTSHLTTEYFKLATGTDILHVPLQGRRADAHRSQSRGSSRWESTARRR